MPAFQSLVLSCFLVAGCAGSMAFHPRSTSLASQLAHAKISWSPQTQIHQPNTTDFFNATERWDVYAPPTYQAAISPATEADVAKAVKLARQLHVPFLATNGRHGYSTTLGDMQGGLAIDLSLLDTIAVDKSAGTLTIGPGVRFREIFEPVYEAGFQIQTGTCSCVGMMGATLGGGIGRLDGLQGLIIDALVSVRIVTADGKILEASKDSNSDLFWGIRGAGQNFGIITSATYALHPLYKGGVWTSADIIITPEKNVSYFETLAKMQPLPADLTVETIVSYNTTLNEPQLKLSVVYAGPKNESAAAMAPILDLEPSYSLIKEIPWTQLSTETAFELDGLICEDQEIWDIYAVNLRDFSVPTMISSFEKMSSFWAENPDGRDSVIVIETWPVQATTAIPDSTTAYPWRDATTYVMVQMQWGAGDAVEYPSQALGRELRNDMAITSGYGGLTVYNNYARGDETLEEIFGKSKLPKLAGLKAKYDPDNAFGFYHALPTKYP